MSLITKEGFVATSGFLPAYGGVILGREPMLEIARAIRVGNIPMHAHHDERITLNPTILSVDVRETDNGELGVWVKFEIDEQEWSGNGDLRAFSITLTFFRYRRATRIG
jgi:hypothetical protein